MLHTPFAVRSIRWGVCIVVIVAIIAGLYVSGSPANRRRLSLDERRVNSLNQITTAIDTFVETKSALPTSLDILAQDQPYLATELRDPTTNALYEYTPSSTSTYDLCATFDLPNEQDPGAPPFAPTQDFWNNPILSLHSAGRVCYPLHVRTPSTQNLPPVAKPLPSAL